MTLYDYVEANKTRETESLLLGDKIIWLDSWQYRRIKMYKLIIKEGQKFLQIPDNDVVFLPEEGEVRGRLTDVDIDYSTGVGILRK